MRKGIFFNLLSRFFFIAGSYVMHMVLARIMGPADYGNFGLCLSILMISYVLTNNGVWQVVSRLVSSQPGASGAILTQGLLVQLFLSGILAFGLAIFAVPLSNLFGSHVLVMPFYLLAAIIILQALTMVYSGVLIGMKSFFRESIIGTTNAILRAILPVSFAILLTGNRLFGSMLGFLLVLLITLVMSAFLVRPLGKTHLTSSLSSMVRESIPVMVAFGMITFLRYVDLLSIKILLSDPNVTGFYNAASAAAQLPFLAMYSFGTVSYPYVTESMNVGDLAAAAKTIESSMRYALVVVIPLVLVIGIFSQPLINFVYSSMYSSAAGPMSILIIGQLLLGVFYIFAQYLAGINRSNIVIGIASLTTLVSVLLNIWLIPRYGIIGAAIATTIAATVGTSLVLFSAKRTFHISLKVFGKFGVIAISIVILNLLLNKNIAGNTMLLRGVAVMFSYLLSLLAMRVVSWSEVASVFSRLRGMGNRANVR